VEELFSFLERNNLPITDDGGFLGYKKLNFVNRIDVPDDFEELFVDSKGEVKNTSGAKVDPVLKTKYLEFINDTNNPLMKDVHSGTIKQRLGEVVRIDRVKLDEESRRQACGYGLHIGAFGYGFSGNVRVLCKVFPGDVIACNPCEQKLRTCKYQIVSFVDERTEVKELLVNLESDKVTPEVEEDDFINPFNPGDVVRATATEDGITPDRYYYVVEVDAEDILIIDDNGDEEWYDATCFVTR
jgi:hypothetical protein